MNTIEKENRKQLASNIQAKGAPRALELAELNELEGEAIVVLAANPDKWEKGSFPIFFESKSAFEGDMMSPGFRAKHPALVGVAYSAKGEEVEVIW